MLSQTPNIKELIARRLRAQEDYAENSAGEERTGIWGACIKQGYGQAREEAIRPAS